MKITKNDELLLLGIALSMLLWILTNLNGLSIDSSQLVKDNIYQKKQKD